MNAIVRDLPKPLGKPVTPVATGYTVGGLFNELRRLGIALSATPDGHIKARPLSIVTDDLRHAIRQHKADVITVLRCADLFREQMAAWTAEGRVGVPVLALTGAPSGGCGTCASCGAAVGSDCLRCDLCATAANLALNRGREP